MYHRDTLEFIEVLKTVLSLVVLIFVIIAADIITGMDIGKIVLLGTGAIIIGLCLLVGIELLVIKFVIVLIDKIKTAELRRRRRELERVIKNIDAALAGLKTDNKE